MLYKRKILLNKLKEDLSSLIIEKQCNEDIQNSLNKIELISKNKLNDDKYLSEEIFNLFSKYNTKEFLLNNKESFLESFFKYNINDEYLDENELNIILNNSAEMFLEEVTKFKDLKPLSEENEAEIKDILNKNLDKFKTSFNTLIDKLSSFINKYLDGKFHFKFDEESINWYKENYREQFKIINSIFDKFKKSNIDYFTNKENKVEIYQNFFELYYRLNVILPYCITLKIFHTMGPSNGFNPKNEMYKYRFTDFLLNVSSIDPKPFLDNPIVYKLSSEPKLNDLLLYIFNSDMNKIDSNDMVSIKRMSLSGKYIHHINQLLTTLTSIFFDYNILIDDLFNDDIERSVNKGYTDRVVEKFNSIKIELSFLSNDLLCFRDSSSNILNDTYYFNGTKIDIEEGLDGIEANFYGIKI